MILGYRDNRDSSRPFRDKDNIIDQRFAIQVINADVTDAYSGKIVGFHVTDDMKLSSAAVALKKAPAQKPAETIVIHRDDRGIQYCSTAVSNRLTTPC